MYLDNAAQTGLNAITSSLSSMGAIIAGMGLSFGLFGGMLGEAIRNSIDFQMILIQMGRAGNLTQAQMQELGQTLMDVGGHSIFSIEELGQAFVALLQRGVSAADIIHGVGQQAVYLAEATGMKAVPAAQLLASTLVSFNIPASEAAKTIDLLQFLIEHGIGPSDELSSSLARLGGIAGILHLSLADITPAFDVLTRATGSYTQAATGLYYFLNQAKFGTAAYRRELENLGLSFYDSQGSFVGLNNALDILANKLRGLSAEKQAQILGSLFNIKQSQGVALLVQDLQQVYGLTHKLATSHDNMGVAMQRALQAEQSAAGLWQSLKSNMQDAFTLMGGPFLAAIQPVLANLNALSIQLRKFMADNPQVGATFVAVGAAISAVGLIVGIVMSPFAEFIGIMLAIVAAVAAVAAGVAILRAHWQQVLTFLHPVIVMFQALLKAMDFGAALQQLKSAWDQLVQAITPALPLLKAVAIGLGLLAGGLILGVVVALVVLARVLMLVVEFVTLLASVIIKDLVTAFNWLYNSSRSVLLGIEGLFHSLPGAVGVAFSQIGTFFHDLINNAWNWGANLIGMFISGIKSAIGGLFSTVGNIAHSISNLLGFHSPPKEGPLADADKYMPNMMKMFAGGIQASVPLLHNALTNAASGIAGVPQLVRYSAPGMVAGGAGGPGGVTIHNQIYLDGKVVYDDFMGRLQGQMQANGLSRAFR